MSLKLCLPTGANVVHVPLVTGYKNIPEPYPPKQAAPKGGLPIV